MMAGIVRWPFIPGATWLEKWMAHRTRISKMVNQREDGSWGNRAIRNTMRMAGHIQRHIGNMSWAVINYRDLAWWTARQLRIKSGPSDLRRPRRYKVRNRETEMESFWKKKGKEHYIERFIGSMLGTLRVK